MNRKIDPMMCDAAGTPLEYDDGREVWVRLRDGGDHPDNVGDGTGVVVSVPNSESEWYGFPLVRFRGAKKASHHVANSTVVVMKAEAVPVRVDPEALREAQRLAGQFRAGVYVSVHEMAELIEKL